jgi:BolA family transcriptional regulator, general stress-responsive regulator
MTGAVQAGIEARLTQVFEPMHLEVANESGMHNVPPGSETHFKVTVVSSHFAGERLLARHRRVNDALSTQLAAGVHALSIHALTAEEWFERYGDLPESPPCLGGSAAEG